MAVSMPAQVTGPARYCQQLLHMVGELRGPRLAGSCAGPAGLVWECGVALAEYLARHCGPGVQQPPYCMLVDGHRMSQDVARARALVCASTGGITQT